MSGNASVGRVHALVVIPGRPLRPRRVQEEAHVLGDAAVDVRVAGALQRALAGTRGGPGPRGLVPPSHGRALVCHLHNHQFRYFRKALAHARYTGRYLLRKVFNSGRLVALLFRSLCVRGERRSAKEERYLRGAALYLDWLRKVIVESSACCRSRGRRIFKCPALHQVTNQRRKKSWSWVI